MKRKVLFFFLLIAGSLLLLYFLLPDARRDSPSSFADARSAQSKIENPKSKIPKGESHNLAAGLNAPAHDIRADLQIVASVIDTYRSNFLQEGNPVGNNADITAALAGENRLRLSLVPKNHPAINPQGELCDRWGTPFFFHAESATHMEIRSAGPDKKLFTADDAVLSP